MKHINDDELYGLQITNMIVPCTSEDDYPTHDSKYGLGGWHEVSTLAERNAIPTERRRLGMACFVREDNTLYILKGNLLNTSWQPYIGISTPDVSVIINDAIQAGQVQINTDLSNYYTSDQVDQILADTATAQEIDDAVAVAEENVKTWVKGQNYLTQHQSLDDYMTKEEIMAELDTRDAANKTYVDTTLESYYDKTAADEKFLTITNAAATYLTLEDFEDFKTDNAATIEAANVEIRTIKNDYATKAEVEGKGYITSETVDDILGEKGYLTSLDMQQYLATNRYVVVSDLDGFATKDWMTETLTQGKYLKLSDLAGYATEAYVDDAVANAGHLTLSDLNGYATEAWVKDYIALNGGGSGEGGGGSIDLSSYVKKTELTETLASYATKTDLSAYTKTANLSTVATSGSYNDLEDKPTIPQEYTLPTASTSVLGGVKVDGTSITIANGIISATATGGESGTTDYTALANKPQINGVVLTGDKSLADLGIQPAGTYLTEIPAEYVTETELEGKGYLTSVPAEYVTETELNGKGYLTTIPDSYVENTDLAAVATSGSYNDLTDKPTIITSYNDLTDKPSIPQAYTLPTASTTTLGGVKVDGTTVTIEDGVITAHATSTGGTSDYSTLTNKPQIGGVELTGNKSLADLGIQAAGTYLTEIPAEYVTETELNGKGYITSAALTGYAQSADIPTATSDLTNDSGFITNSVNNLTNYTPTSGLSAVATSGSYADLTNKPTRITSYNDLTDKPSIPAATSDLTNDSGFITNSVNNLTNYTPTSGLATVATSGSYDDLTNKPTIPTAYTLPTASTTVLGGVKVDGSTINIADGVISANLTGYAQTSAIPTATSDLTNDSGFITNAVNNLTNYTPTSGLATVATSGSYNDLEDKPSIPQAYTLPTASTTVLGGVKVDGATVTIADGVISSTAKPGANFYIYGNSGVPDISPAASNLIPVSRFQNYDLNNSRLQVGDILIDLEGTIAYVTSVNSGPTDPNSWTFNVTDDSIVIKLQTRTDETLTTTDKTIVGAINELLSKIEALEARVTALETPTA